MLKAILRIIVDCFFEHFDVTPTVCVCGQQALRGGACAMCRGGKR